MRIPEIGEKFELRYPHDTGETDQYVRVDKSLDWLCHHHGPTFPRRPKEGTAFVCQCLKTGDYYHVSFDLPGAMFFKIISGQTEIDFGGDR